MPSRRLVLALFALLIVVGLADSAYLTWDHYAYKADPANFGGGLCGEGGGCEISRAHAASGIAFPGGGPGVPISLLGAAFYLAFAALTWARARRPEDMAPRRLQLGLSFLAVVYSAVLAGISLKAQGRLCELCTVLYGTNLLLFVLSALTLGESPLLWARRVWPDVATRTALVTALVFVLVAGGGYALYRAQLPSGRSASSILNDGEITAFDTTQRNAKGPVDAPIQIVEFSDIQCPFCERLFDTLEEVQAARPDLVRVTFMHFPLDRACNPMMTRDFHDMARELARIAECAGRQGRFFEIAGTLFDEHRGKSAAEALDLVVERHGATLDVAALRTCAADPAVFEAIRGDIERGAKAKITGTPVFFVNGHKISGAKPRELIDELIDEALSGARIEQE